ncbi:MAG: hypothetical protein AABZ32_00310 [Bacteroidota bacterium]
MPQGKTRVPRTNSGFDKLVYEVADEQNALKALQVAEEKVKYQIRQKK